MPTFRIKQAAGLLGVSTDTLRRWADGRRVETTTDVSGRMAVDGAALARLAQDLAAAADHDEAEVVAARSARNRFTGLVTRVVRDTVMAQVDIQAGPHRFVSLLSREAADQLGLVPGMLAVAAVKATSVSVEIPANRSTIVKVTAPAPRQSRDGQITIAGNNLSVVTGGVRTRHAGALMVYNQMNQQN